MMEVALIGLVVLIHLLILAIGIPAQNEQHKSRVAETPDKDPRYNQ